MTPSAPGPRWGLCPQTTERFPARNLPLHHCVYLISIRGRDPSDQPIVFDAVHVTLGCMSEIVDFVLRDRRQK